MRTKRGIAITAAMMMLGLGSVAVTGGTAHAAGKAKSAIARVDCQKHTVESRFTRVTYQACGKMINGKKHVQVRLWVRDVSRDLWGSTGLATIGSRDGSHIRVQSARAKGGKGSESVTAFSPWKLMDKPLYVYALV
ncbi:hypothetical protein [Streptomyces sp. NPDC047928]|uniref:hypothetical protein n=1 Tax=unclassified Streptomyces TaxID=2593676 RepID=UPI003719C8EE